MCGHWGEVEDRERGSVTLLHKQGHRPVDPGDGVDGDSGAGGRGQTAGDEAAAGPASGRAAESLDHVQSRPLLWLVRRAHHRCGPLR